MSALSSDTEHLDRLPRLPGRALASLALVLAVTLLNAFNDNLLKMMLVGLAPKAAAGMFGATARMTSLTR